MPSSYEMVCRELAVVEAQLYRAKCKVKCLEANLTRITPDQFDDHMVKLEEAKRWVEECRGQYEHLRHWKATSDFRELMNEYREAEARGEVDHCVYHG